MIHGAKHFVARPSSNENSRRGMRLAKRLFPRPGAAARCWLLIVAAFWSAATISVSAASLAGENGKSSPSQPPAVEAKQTATIRTDTHQTEAKQAAPAVEFIRIVRDDAKQPVALETAIVRLSDGKPGGVRVALVAAIHVAENSYYTELNRRFKQYDAVLYELVAPPEAQVPVKGQKSSHPVSLLQRGMKQMLDLEFQLDLIDYKAANMVHADMSPDEFSKAMKERGESFWTLFWRMMNHAMAQQAKSAGRMPSDWELITALFDRKRSHVLKRMLAEQMIDLEGMTAALEGPNGSALVSGRNGKAIEVLEKTLAEGKRNVAIFYGAAHMPDFLARLSKQFDLRPEGTDWIEAWNLQAKPADGKRSAAGEAPVNKK